LHPPSEVVDSYYEVAKAMEKRDMTINQATERATRITKANDAQVEKILTEARATRAEKIQEADRDHQRFNALYQPRRDHPALVDFRIYWDSIGKALSGRELLLIDSDKVAGRRNLMLFDPELFRAAPPVIMQPGAPFRPPIRPPEFREDP
jgi:regulator of protease activity HflC (stomatin/prohibitin superfamily)